MKPERPSIQGVGTVSQVLGPNLFQVDMPNGYQVMAPRDHDLEVSEISEGQTVLMEFSPYNMKQARIVGDELTPGDLG